MKIHTEEKPYICNIEECSQQYSQVYIITLIIKNIIELFFMIEFKPTQT